MLLRLLLLFLFFLFFFFSIKWSVLEHEFFFFDFSDYILSFLFTTYNFNSSFSKYHWGEFCVRLMEVFSLPIGIRTVHINTTILTGSVNILVRMVPLYIRYRSLMSFKSPHQLRWIRIVHVHHIMLWLVFVIGRR